MTDFSDEQKMGIACRFKKFREDLRITQGVMERLLDASQNSIEAVEEGEALPTLPMITFLHEKYGLSLTWLLTGRGKMRVSPNPKELIKRRLPPDCEEYKEEAAFMIYCVEKVPLVRDYLLSYFIIFHFKNKERIQDCLSLYDGVD